MRAVTEDDLPLQRMYRWERERAARIFLTQPVGNGAVRTWTWEQAVGEDWLGRWAMNLMLINVSTRKFRRAVRLPEGDVPAPAGSGVSKSAASRHFVALSAARMREWMASDLSKLDLLVVQSTAST